MYRLLGQLISRWYWPVALAWFAFLALAIWLAPPFEAVTKTGEFAFLPANEQSPRAERLFREAFPGGPDKAELSEEGVTVQQNPLGSSVVLVLRREQKEGLTEADREFIRKHLVPAMQEVKENTPAIIFRLSQPLPKLRPTPPEEQIVRSITTFDDPKVGLLLDSPDKKSTLVVIDLKTEFLDRTNILLIHRVREAIDRLYEAKVVPLQLEIATSGSASVGRDMIMAEADSAKKTDFITKFLCIALLLVIYRAPILAFIPLLTVGITVPLAVHLLLIMAKYNLAGMFTGLETYIVVVVYGAGIDYCLFLIARYREELDNGHSFSEAISIAVEKVGAALATSAATSIFGIGMMMFAEFGKFREAGFAISFGLLIALCSCLTLSPAMLRIFGRWTFWPDVRKERITAEGSWVAESSIGRFLQEKQWLDRMWRRVSDSLDKHPGKIFLGSILVMLPFAVVGIAKQRHLSYGLLTDLPQTYASVEGARAIQLHFPAGMAGTTTVLIRDENLGLKTKDSGLDAAGMRTGREISRYLEEYLISHKEALSIADVRSQFSPLGIENSKALRAPGPTGRTAQLQSYRNYASLTGPEAGKVLRMDIVYEQDPFSRESFDLLTRTEDAIRTALRDYPKVETEGEEEGPTPRDLSKAEVYTLGATSSMRDVKIVTDRDQIRIYTLVTLVCYLLIVILLRQPAICAFLIISVIFSYAVALGATYILFSVLHGEGFPGIDWKIPIFLFTLLLALGGDYNILLMARVVEEQQKHGPIQGVLIAMQKTGGIISSCGVIMAGTFVSLMTGSLEGMIQMGFALTVGVLLDTFMIRPVLVPSYLILLYKGFFGPLTNVLGGRPPKMLAGDGDADGGDPLSPSPA